MSKQGDRSGHLALFSSTITMDAWPPSLQNLKATPNTPLPSQRPVDVSDEIFHLSPFLALDHRTITPAYYYTESPIPVQQQHHTPTNSSVHLSRRNPNRQSPPHDLAHDDDSQTTNENDDDDSPHDVSSSLLVITCQV